jgi:hypothetical protein
MQSSSNVDLETKSLHAKRVVAGAEMIELVTTKTPKLRGSQNAEISSYIGLCKSYFGCMNVNMKLTKQLSRRLAIERRRRFSKLLMH